MAAIITAVADDKDSLAGGGQSEQRFSLLGPTIRPLWFFALGFVFVLIAMFIWWQAFP